MSVFWCLFWGMSVFAVMFFTAKYYLPLLRRRVKSAAPKAPFSPSETDDPKGPPSVSSADGGEGLSSDADKIETSCAPPSPASASQDSGGLNSEPKKALERSPVFSSPVPALLLLCACALFAAWCGYTAAAHATSVVSMWKMTLGMGVLSCAFITDTALAIIPNLCSLVLLGGRVVTIICEFIWARDEAAAWLVNSLIAFAVSLLLLLLLAVVTKGGLGMGDVKLFCSLGFLCGIQAVFFTLVFSFLLSGLVSLVLLASRKKRLKDAVSLGPFIWLGFGVTVLLSII